jgi:hypothetical protein
MQPEDSGRIHTCCRQFVCMFWFVASDLHCMNGNMKSIVRLQHFLAHALLQMSSKQVHTAVPNASL